MTSKHKLSVRTMVFTAIMSAIICVFAPFSIPMGAIPLSLATFAVYLSAALLGKAESCAAVAVYILIGLIGVPVFSGFMGGFAVISGMTGGYIIGYIPCAFLTALFTEHFCGRLWAMAAGMALGTITLYAVGTGWFMIFTGSELVTALSACVIPFLIGDIAKIAAACTLALPLRKKLLPMMASDH